MFICDDVTSGVTVIATNSQLALALAHRNFTISFFKLFKWLLFKPLSIQLNCDN